MHLSQKRLQIERNGQILLDRLQQKLSKHNIFEKPYKFEVISETVKDMAKWRGGGTKFDQNFNFFSNFLRFLKKMFITETVRDQVDQQVIKVKFI